jgi:hypothetical protein
MPLAPPVITAVFPDLKTGFVDIVDKVKVWKGVGEYAG